MVAGVPILNIEDGYIIALEKIAYTKPLQNGGGRNLVSAQLIFNKFNPDGDLVWETTYELPIK